MITNRRERQEKERENTIGVFVECTCVCVYERWDAVESSEVGVLNCKLDWRHPITNGGF